jgi:hypothetical protein
LPHEVNGLTVSTILILGVRLLQGGATKTATFGGCVMLGRLW